MLLSLILCVTLAQSQSPNLARFNLNRSSLRVSPEKQTVLINGSMEPLQFQLQYEGTFEPTFVFKADWVGEGSSQPIEVQGEPGKPFLNIPSHLYPIAGSYVLSQVRVEHEGEVLAYATPSRAEVLVLDQLLVTAVEVRPLSQADLATRGYLFSARDYRIVTFSLSLVVGANYVRSDVDVALPTGSRGNFEPVVLKDPFKPAFQLQVKTQPELVDTLFDNGGRVSNESYSFYSMLLLPGEFTLMKTHFSVACIVTNISSAEVNAQVKDLKAELVLPPASRFGNPLSVAESLQQAVIKSSTTAETAVPENNLGPGEKGKAEYLVTGELEGLHQVKVRVSGNLNLDGKTFPIQSDATGKVLVRNPDYLLTMEHPDTVAIDEPYEVQLIFKNQSRMPLDGIVVTLNPNELIGTELYGSDPEQVLGSVAPESTKTLTYHMRSKVSGRVIASYFRLDDSAASHLQFQVGVGESGEKLSANVVTFPRYFDSQLPAGIPDLLRRYARKLIDFQQTRVEDLPPGMSPMNLSMTREAFDQLTGLAKASAWGLPDAEVFAELCAVWSRVALLDPAVDAARRRILTSSMPELETAMGAVLGEEVSAWSASDILRLLARLNQTQAGFFAVVVEGNQPNWSISNGLSQRCGSDGSRSLPFAALFPLGNHRFLALANGFNAAINLEIQGASKVSLLQKTQEGFAALFDEPLDSSLMTLISQNAKTGEWTRSEGHFAQSLALQAIGTEPLQVQVRQLDPDQEVRADRLGRTFVCIFSKPIDLASLDPVEKHIWFAGQTITSASLQSDKRFLMIKTAQPLGPYSPIPYQFEGIRAVDESATQNLSGLAIANNFFTGVQVAGRVVDQFGSGLEQARVFLFLKAAEFEGENQSTNQINWRLMDETQLDQEGKYHFDFVPTPVFKGHRCGWENSFRIGILLSDGRYKEETFYTRESVGVTVPADFAFLATGQIQGRVLNSQGQAIPFAPVFSANQNTAFGNQLTQTDYEGRFVFQNQSVGPFVLKSLSGNRLGIASGYLSLQNSPLELDIQIQDQVQAQIRGRISFKDGEQAEVPVADAFVGFRNHNDYQQFQTDWSYGIGFSVGTRTDAEGYYQIDGAQPGLGELVVYHPQYSQRSLVLHLVEGMNGPHDYIYQNVDFLGGTVAGSIVDNNNQAVAGATVSAAGRTVLSDAAGHFEIEGLPLNRVTKIIAERDSLSGNTSVFLDESVSDLRNLVILVRRPSKILGVYYDSDGQPMPFTQVNLINKYTAAVVACPGLSSLNSNGLIQPQTEANGSFVIPFGSDGCALFSEDGTPRTVSVTGSNPPKIAETENIFLGSNQDIYIELRERPSTDIRVQLLDGYGNPVMGSIELQSQIFDNRPALYGTALNYTETHFSNQDGSYVFHNINTGRIRLKGLSPLLGQTPQYSNDNFSQADGLLTLALTFPQTETANLFGRVFDSDGVSPAPAGTVVQAQLPLLVNGGQSFFATAIVDANGDYRFDSLVQTATSTPVQLVIYNKTTGAFATSSLQLRDSLRYRHDLILSRAGRLRVKVANSDGSPAEVAFVEANHRKLTVSQSANGDFAVVSQAKQFAQLTQNQEFVEFEGIPSGDFRIQASSGNGLTGIRAYAMPMDGSDLELSVRLEASSDIHGIFLNHEEEAIADAEVQLRNEENTQTLMQKLSGAAGEGQGRFDFLQVPMRSYQIRGTDPSSGFTALAEVTTSPFQPEVNLVLKLDTLIQLEGRVMRNGEPLAGASVSLRQGTQLPLLTGTDAEGRYVFVNIRPGRYVLEARLHSEVEIASTTLVVEESPAIQTAELNFLPTSDLTLLVLRPDESIADRVLVRLTNLTTIGQSAVFTDNQGQIRFPQLPLGTYSIEIDDAKTPIEPKELSLALTEADLGSSSRTVRMPGWGTVVGHIRNSRGEPISEATAIQIGKQVIKTDATGYFRLGLLPVDTTHHFQAFHPISYEWVSGDFVLGQHLEEQELNLQFKDYSRIEGKVLFADGSPGAHARVSVDKPIYREVFADDQGLFSLEPAVAGPLTLIARDFNSVREAKLQLELSRDANGALVPLTHAVLQFSGLARLEGEVLYSDNDPVQSGYVSLESAGRSYRAVISGGSFVFPNLPLGTHKLSAYDSRLAKTAPDQFVTLATDGALERVQLHFEASFSLGGLVLAADGSTPVTDALVELWRNENNRNTRIYSAKTNDQGYYRMDKVYPGLYRIEANNSELSQLAQLDLQMPGAESQQNVTLGYSSSLIGTVADASGYPLTGKITVVQNGKTVTTALQSGGQFELQKLLPGRYDLFLSASEGWVQAQVFDVLTPGVNPLELRTEETVSISGQAYYLDSQGSKFRAFMLVNGIARPLQLDASGQYNMDSVPVNQLVSLRLVHDSFHKDFVLGSFQEDSQVGTQVMEPVYLDRSGPLISFDQAGFSFTSWPIGLRFGLEEPDQQSRIETQYTRVFLNHRDISSFFSISQTEIQGSLDLFSPGLTRGENRIVVRAYNDSNAVTEQEFSFEIQQTGTNLVIRLKEEGQPVAGQARDQAGHWIASDDQQRIVLYNQSAEDFVLKLKSADKGHRTLFHTGNAFLQETSFELGAVGEYRGRVLDPSGQPVAGAKVSSYPDYEHTDAQGRFTFDLLPLTDHHFEVNHEGLFGEVDPAKLLIPQQVVLNTDIQLLGVGTVTGTVFDNDGSTPLAGTSVRLVYTSPTQSPTQIPAPVLSGADGRFMIENVYTLPFRLDALHTDTRIGRTSGELNSAGESREYDIRLFPPNLYSGLALRPDGSPASSATVLVKHNWLAEPMLFHADANGTFELRGIPEGYWVFQIVDQDEQTFFRSERYLTNASDSGYPLGSFQLRPNLPPSLEQTQLPDRIYPGRVPYVRIQVSDDYLLDSIQITLSGVTQATQLIKTNEASFGCSGNCLALPTTLSEGTLEVYLLVRDAFGLSAELTHLIEVRADADGPEVSILEPAPDVQLTAGSPLTLRVHATDPNYLRQLQLLYGGRILETRSADGIANDYSFQTFTPAAPEIGAPGFAILAIDGEGNQSYTPVPLFIEPPASGAAPLLKVLSPVADMPLPFQSVSQLILPLAAELEDAAGLFQYVWFVNEQHAATGYLLGNKEKIEDFFEIPGDIAQASELQVRLEVSNVAGQKTSWETSLQNIAGEIHSEPLTLSALNLSFEGRSLILVGGEHVVDGAHSFENLVLVNGAQLTQSKTSDDQSQLALSALQIANKLVISYDCAFLADGKGFSNVPSAVPHANSLSFAGLGVGKNDRTALYGSALRPQVPGVGGGGGAIQLAAPQIWLLGKISARPSNSAGSGGSIWLESAEFHGFGSVLANGYNKEAAPNSWDAGVSGGRIAIYGAFAGIVEAFGGNHAGAGTIYQRIPEPTQADGYLDRLILANSPGSSSQVNLTGLIEGFNLRAGIDFSRESLNEAGQITEYLRFNDSNLLPWRAFEGMLIRNTATGETTRIESQESTRLWAATGAHFPSFNQGDLFEIVFDLDEIEVFQQVQFATGAHRFTERIRVQDAAVLVDLPEGQASDWRAADFSFAGNVVLQGQFLFENWVLEDQAQVQLEGTWQGNQLDLRRGTFRLNGEIQVQSLNLESAAILSTIDGFEKQMRLEAAQMRIDGQVLAISNGKQNTTSYDNAHGGLGGSGSATGVTYGSLYRADSQGKGNDGSIRRSGGILQLHFGSLTLNGQLTTQPDRDGSGGSISLSGQSLNGSGSINARGADYYAGGGGRIALLVNDLGSFQGTFHAEGGYRAGQPSGGAGTIYLRTLEWPLGKLLIDNAGHSSNLPVQTPLPGLGSRVAAQATGAGPIVEGSNFPDSLAGLYLEVPGFDPVRIDHNSATQLFAAAGENFPPIAAGQSYSGAHYLNILELRGMASLQSMDRIVLSEPAVIVDGSSSSTTQLDSPDASGDYTDGSFEIYDTTNFTNLRLVNAQVTVNVPIHAQSVNIDANSRLILNQPLNANSISVDGGKIIAQSQSQEPSLIAGQMELKNGAAWTVGPRKADGSTYPLVGRILGELLVDSTSSIYTDAPTMVPSYNFNWGGKVYRLTAHGGVGLPGVSNTNLDGFALGSYRWPTSPACGGAIHIRAHHLSLLGSIHANGMGNNGAAGSIWLDLQELTGTGQLSARADSGFGSGRIAIYYDQDNSFLQTLSIQLDSSWNSNNGPDALAGAGTLFLKSAQQAEGELILDQKITAENAVDKVATRLRLQSLTGLPEVTLNLEDTDPNPLVISDPSWTNLPPGLAGLWIRFEQDGQLYQARVLENSVNSIRLEQPVAEIVSAGTQIEFELHLDRLTLRNGAQVAFPGTLVVDDLHLEGIALNSIWAKDLKLPAGLFELSDQKLRLDLEQPSWQDRSLSLLRSQLWSDFPLQLQEVRLNQSWLSHSDARNTVVFLVPHFQLETQSFTADALSGIDVSNKGNKSSDNHNHGGIYQVTRKSFGNLFQPQYLGSGAGALHLKTQSLQGGQFLANSPNQTAGSVWVESDSIGGTIKLSANSDYYSGAGRVALEYNHKDAQTELQLSAKSAVLANNANVSAGTAFVRSPEEPNGRLILDNGNNKGNNQDTRLPSMPIQTLGTNATVVFNPQAQASRLTLPNLSLEEDFSGYRLIINGDKSRHYPILASTTSSGQSSFTLAGDLSFLSAGDQVQLGLLLDQLERKGSCQLSGQDLLILDETPPQLLSIQAPASSLPGRDFHIQVSARDNIQLAEIRVSFNGSSLNATQGESDFVFTAPQPATAQDFPIEVQVRDSAGLSVQGQSSIRVLEVDSIPPNLSILEPAEGARFPSLESFTMLIHASDNRELAEVRVRFNGVEQVQVLDPGLLEQTLSFTWTTPSLPQTTSLELEASCFDRVGLSNTTRVHVEVVGTNNETPPPLPVAYWSFDSADAVNNKPYNLISGKVANYSAFYSQPSNIGQCANFGGSSHHIDAPEVPALTEEFTLTAWVKQENLSNGGIVTFGNESVEVWSLMSQQTGGRSFRFSVAGSYSVNTATTDNQWHFVAATFKQGDLSIYLDGALQEQKQVPLQSIPTSRPWLVMGIHHPGPDLPFPGSIDEVLLFDQELTASQIQAQYQAWLAGTADFKPPKPIANLKVIPETNALNLTWTASPGPDLARYQVQVEGVGNFDLPASATQFRIPELTAFSSYKLRVVAYDSLGNFQHFPEVTAATDLERTQLPQPLVHWSFESTDISGKFTYDLRGNLLSNYSNVYKQTGKVGQGYKFEAYSHVVESVESPLLQSTRFALGFWFNPDSFTENATLLSLGTRSQELYSISLQSKLNGFPANGLRFQLGAKNSSNTVNFGAEMGPNNKLMGQMTTGNWYYLLLNYDEGHLQAYLNGKLEAEVDLPASALASNPLAFLCLGRSSTTQYPASTFIDEFSIWPEPVSAAMAPLLYELGQMNLIPDFRPPKEISEVKIQATTTTALVSWVPPPEPAASFAGYLVERDGQQPQSLPNNASSLSLTGLAPGSITQLRIYTLDEIGNQSAGVPIQVASLPNLENRPQPYSYWSFNTADRLGTLPIDLRGQITTLSVNAYQQAMLFNQGYKFEAYSHAIELFPPEFTISDGFALSFWFLSDSFSNNATLFSLGTRSHEIFSISMQASGGKRIRAQFADKTSLTYIEGGSRLASNNYLAAELNSTKWHQLSVSFENNRLSLFIDGELANEREFAPSEIPHLEQSFLSFGRRTLTAGNDPANMALDEATLWDQPLSPEMIALLHQTGRAGFELKSAPLDYNPPLNASNLRCSSAANSLSFTWAGSIDTGADFIGYRLYLDDQLKADLPKTTTQSSVIELPSNTAFEARLTVYDQYGNESAGILLPVGTLPDDNGVPLPVSYWSLDSNTKVNNLFRDLMNRNNATYQTGYAQANGISAEAWTFESSVHRIECNGSASLDTLDALTLSTWVYTNSWNDKAGLMVYGSDVIETYGLVQTNASGYGFRFQSKDGSSLEVLDSPRKIGPNGSVYQALLTSRWYHVAVSFDRGQVKLYLDGRLSASATWNRTSLPLDAARKLILGLHRPDLMRFSGYLDEVAVWDRALSLAEIRQPYLLGLRNRPLLSTNDGKDAAQNLAQDGYQPSGEWFEQADGFQLQPFFHSPDSREDRDAILLVNETLRLRDFQTAKRIWLVNSQLSVEGSFEATSLHLQQGSQILFQSTNQMRLSRLKAEHLEVSKDSKVLFEQQDRDDELEIETLVLQPGMQDLFAFEQAKAGLLAPEARNGWGIELHEMILDGLIRIPAAQPTKPELPPIRVDLYSGEGSIAFIKPKASAEPLDDSGLENRTPLNPQIDEVKPSSSQAEEERPASPTQIPKSQQKVQTMPKLHSALLPRKSPPLPPPTAPAPEPTKPGWDTLAVLPKKPHKIKPQPRRQDPPQSGNGGKGYAKTASTLIHNWQYLSHDIALQGKSFHKVAQRMVKR